jgi:metal-dependent amidase/aminoacylase/carboxypeptidase family protein
LHTPTFDIDEEALRIGAKILARAAIYLADPDREP